MKECPVASESGEQEAPTLVRPGSIAGRVTLITGAGRGIGAAIATAMSAAGAVVAIADIDEEAASRTADRIARTSQGAALAVRADCGNIRSMQSMFERVTTELGPVEVLVNNAGVTRPAALLDCTEDDWDRIMRVNAKGLFFCTQYAAREMINRGLSGRIINISSISGRGFALASSPIYAASKGAVIAITRISALQLAGHGINVNAICPGPTKTEFVRQTLESRAQAQHTAVDDATSDVTRHIPLGRLQEPEDIAQMAVFLASTGGHNITGQCYNVDGGLVLS